MTRSTLDERLRGVLRARAHELRAQLETDRQPAVRALQSHHTQWARSALGIGPGVDLVHGVRARVDEGVSPEIVAEAVEQLRDAEEWQWEIGTWSSAGGEGLASMFTVRQLQLARAWLLSTRATDDSEAVDQARELARQVAEDPNDVAAKYRADVEALAMRLGQS